MYAIDSPQDLLEGDPFNREQAMADTRQHPILNYLRHALGTAAHGGVADADLLRRFVRGHDEAAFELLLWRHAAMVLHVCRQVLGDADAAEDAFQATFLVFVRKAGSISRRESLGSWLYRVAHRIALKARAQAKKQPLVHSELHRIETPAEADDAGQRELRRMICEEVNRLPAKYRAPIVACYFEAKTHEEAAHQLGWPRGTVAGRLARAREMLRRRLVRRGVGLSAALFTAAASATTSQAALARLIDPTIQAAKLFAARSSANVLTAPRIAALAEGVLQAMYWTRVKIVVVVLLVASLGGVGATLWNAQRSTAEPPDESAPRVGGAAGPRGGGADAGQPDNAAQITRHMALSRLNLKKLAAAMHNYNGTMGAFPASAICDKKGKALLSWRVALLPYLNQQDLYKQFHLDEPWDGPHNKKLLVHFPKVYAPPGVKTRQPFSTFYQVFVSAGPKPVALPGGAGGPGAGAGNGSAAPGGASGGPGGPPGATAVSDGGTPGAGAAAAPVVESWGITAAFVKGRPMRIANIPDGTSNTILIVEAGNSVPWTKPEDLHYASDEPLPELGGLFPDVFHAAFADRAVHTLTKRYDERHLRFAITCNGGEVMDWKKIEAQPRRGAQASGGEGDGDLAKLRRANEALRDELQRARQQLQQLKEERDVQRELSSGEERRPPRDPRGEQLLREQAQLRDGLKKAQAEIEALKVEIRRLQKPMEKKGR